MARTPANDAREVVVLGRALSVLRRRAGMTQADAAVVYDVTTQAWQNYEAGKRPSVFRLDQLQRLTAAVDATPAELERVSRLLGEGQSEAVLADPGALAQDYPPARSSAGPATIAALRPSQPLPPAGMADVAPVYGVAVAGPEDAVVFTPDEPEDWMPLHPNQVGRPNPFYVRVMGDSVSPRFESGELAPALRGVWPRRGQACVVETVGNNMLVKFYLSRDEAGVRLLELQPQRREFTLPYSEIRAVHAIVGGAV